MKGVVSLPAPLTFAELQACPTCYADQVQLMGSPQALLDGLRTQVIEPVVNFQKLFDAHEYVTRLYTTMSAAEMTSDPVFTFNSSLPTVSNVHQAERVIECRSDLFQSEAPWRIQLPQGLVRGTGRDAAARIWPAFDSQPSNTRIVRLAPTGEGVVLEDNSQVIAEQLDAYNKTLPGNGGGTGGNSGQGNTTGGTSNPMGGTSNPTGGASNPNGGALSGAGGTGTGAGESGEGGADSVQAGGGCAIALRGQQSQWSLLVALSVIGMVRRRRRVV
jgi:hypothetical protein